MPKGFAIATITGAVLILTIASWPVTTRYGVDYDWRERKIPLFTKALLFVQRDAKTRKITREVVEGLTAEEEKLDAIQRWVDESIDPQPSGVPIVDDHILNIIERGYGTPDQRSEVFALLASYADMPSTTAVVETKHGSLIIRVVEVGGEKRAFDVVNGVEFLNPDSTIPTIPQLAADRAKLAATIRPPNMPTEAYAEAMDTLNGWDIRFTRMEMQQPLPRLRYELRRFFLVAGWTG